MIELLQGSILERATRLEVGSGLLLTQNADGIAKLDVNPAAAVTLEYADTHYLKLSGGTLTGDLNVPHVFSNQLYADSFVQAGTGVNGFLRMTQGDTAHTGYLEFFRPSATRNGYMGYDLNNILMQLESGASFLIGATGYTTIGPTGSVIIAGSSIDRLTLSGSPTNNLQIALGDSSVSSRLGTMLSSGAPFISYNAYQNTPSADSWTQSYGPVGSTMLELAYGSEVLSIYTAPAGRSLGTKGAFWSTPIFRLTSGGWPIVSSGATYFYGAGPDEFGGSGKDNYGGNAPYIFNYHTGFTFTTHDAYGGLRIYAQGYPVLWPSTLVARFMQSAITLVSPVNMSAALTMSSVINATAGNGIKFQSYDAGLFVGVANVIYIGDYAAPSKGLRVNVVTGGVSATHTFDSNTNTVTLTSSTSPGVPGTYGYRVFLSAADRLALGADGTYSYVQSFGGNQLYLNQQGNAVIVGASGITSQGIVRVATYLYADGSPASGMVGLYDPTKYQMIYAMGDAYKPLLNGTGAATCYGLLWIYDYLSGYINATGRQLEHAAVVYAAGTPRSALGMNGIWTAGFVWAGGNITAGGTIFATSTISTSAYLLAAREIRAGAYGGAGHVDGDITARRSATTGVYYFGDYTDRYLYYDGTKFNLAGGSLRLGSGQVEAADFLLI